MNKWFVSFADIPIEGKTMHITVLGAHARNYTWVRRYTYIYLLLSALSGFLELGAVTLPIRSGVPFLFALVVGMV